MLEYFKIIEDMLIDMFSASIIIRKINKANHKGYVYDKSKYKMENEDPRHAKAILQYLKFKEKEKIKTEEQQEIIAERVQGCREGTSSVTFKLLIMNCKIYSINLFIFNYLVLI